MSFNINFGRVGKEFVVNILSMMFIFLSGLAMAITYYIMDTVQTSFLTVNCLIPDNALITTCQEWFNLALYPVLNLKYILIFASYFWIFGLVFGLFYLGFKTKKHPILFAVHIMSSIIIGYLSIEIANIYRTFLTNEFLYDALVPFAIYNKVMLYFPQFMFFIIFLSGIIGFFGLFSGRGQFKEGNEDLQ